MNEPNNKDNVIEALEDIRDIYRHVIEKMVRANAPTMVHLYTDAFHKYRLISLRHIKATGKAIIVIDNRTDDRYDARVYIGGNFEGHVHMTLDEVITILYRGDVKWIAEIMQEITNLENNS